MKDKMVDVLDKPGNLTGLTEEEKLTKKAYDNSAAAWATYFNAAEGWKDELKKFHKLLPNGRILEIGAGTGRDAENLVNLGYDYTGTDISDELLKKAREKLPQQKFIQMSLYNLKFPEKFDGFWASAVLLHIPKNKVDRALQKIKSTQKKNAIGFISIKDGKGNEFSDREMGGINTTRFFEYWSRQDFEKVLKKNGYKVMNYDYRTVTKNTQWHMFIVRVL